MDWTRRWLGLLLMAALTGCATMTNQGRQPMKVESNPPGATVYVDGKIVGLTPSTLSVPRKQNTLVRIALDGYQDHFLRLKGVIDDPLVILDCLTIAGGLVDLASGAAYHMKPEQVNATLQPVDVVATGAGQAIRRVSAPRGAYASVAVAEMDAQGVSSTDAAVVSEMLRNRLVNAGGFTVVEKKNMQKVLGEQAFQQTGCTSAECAVKLGKLLNVRGIVVGTFGRFLGRYVLSVRLVDVETGQAVLADEAKGDSVDQIERAVEGMVMRMAAALK
ncbi:MAG: PEGA domain-containing protein [Candidatus Coatesbacteria bacterium]